MLSALDGVAMLAVVVPCALVIAAWVAIARRFDAVSEQITLLRGQVDFANRLLAEISEKEYAAPAQVETEPVPQEEILQHENVSAVSRSAKVREWMAQLEYAAAQERERVNAE